MIEVMAEWLQYLLAGLALLVIAPLIAWLAKRHAKGARGNLALAAILLGIGEPIDPPSKHKVESAEPGKDNRAPGEPPLED
jgi:hypothetical protein